MTISVPATAPVALRPAREEEIWAVTRLFTALHEFNARLDAHFGLAEGWEKLLREHFTRTCPHDLTVYPGDLDV